MQAVHAVGENGSDAPFGSLTLLTGADVLLVSNKRNLLGSELFQGSSTVCKDATLGLVYYLVPFAVRIDESSASQD
jgi:hypothetical protein